MLYQPHYFQKWKNQEAAPAEPESHRPHKYLNRAFCNRHCVKQSLQILGAKLHNKAETGKIEFVLEELGEINKY